MATTTINTAIILLRVVLNSVKSKFPIAAPLLYLLHLLIFSLVAAEKAKPNTKWTSKTSHFLSHKFRC
jgi:hypothetical protein